MKFFRNFAISLLLLTLSASALAQAPTTQKSANKQAVQPVLALQDHRLVSKLMAREMPYRVILPKNYEADKAARYPVLYLLHGLTGHFDNWTNQSKLKEHASGYNFIIVTPEGDNGWYTDSATVPNDKYESYIMRELIPEIDAKFRTLSNRENRAIAGLSMGGYGALKFGLKHPDKFVVAGSFSGALGAASWTDKILGNNWKVLTDSIMSVYGAEDNPARRDNDIYRLVREISPEKIKALPFIYVDCGTEDFLIQQNRDFNALLAEKKIPHEYRELPGKHDWAYWDAQVREFLRVSQKFIK